MSELKRGNNFKHGMRHTPIYDVWHNMIRRCNDPKNNQFYNYGARGIRVCDEWRKFENFYKDMGDKPKGMTLDRKDNNGNYEHSNCHWATSIEQGSNKRNNHFLEINGELLTMKNAARKYDIPYQTFCRRIYRGMPIELAICNKSFHRTLTSKEAKQMAIIKKEKHAQEVVRVIRASTDVNGTGHMLRT